MNTLVSVIMILECRYKISPGECYTHMKTKAPWLVTMARALVLVYCCCTAAVVVTKAFAVAFEIPRKEMCVLSPCPLRNILAPLLRLGVRSYRKHSTHTHIQMHRPWASQKEELDVRLLLYHGCHEVESLRA